MLSLAVFKNDVDIMQVLNGSKIISFICDFLSGILSLSSLSAFFSQTLSSRAVAISVGKTVRRQGKSL